MNIANGQPMLLITGLILLTIIAFLLSVKMTLRELGHKTGSMILLLRCIILICLLILLLNPYHTIYLPDKDSFSIAVLVDVSGSMQTRDGNRQYRRIDIVDSFLGQDTSTNIVQTFDDQFIFTKTSFAETTNGLTANYMQLPNNNSMTAIGDALLSTVNKQQLSSKALAGIVLISDGHNNKGSDLSGVIHHLQQAKIPVTVIGVGDRVEDAGLKVRFEERRVNTILGAKTPVVVLASHHNKEPVKVLLELKKGDDIVDSEIVDIPPGETSRVNFEIITDYSGIETYTVTIHDTEAQQITNSQQPRRGLFDKVLVFSERSDRRKILYISENLPLDYRFIKQSLLGEEFMEFNSLIRLSENKYYRRGENLPDGLPEDPNFWQDFDVILIHSNVLTLLSDAVMSGLHDFVNRRGGGLMVFGPLGIEDTTPLDTQNKPHRTILNGLLPGRRTETSVAQPGQHIKIIWPAIEAPPLDHLPPLSTKTRIQILTRTNFAAQTLVWSSPMQTPLLTVQNFGAGKSAYWGVSDNWRMSLQNKESHETFQHFWQYLIYWLGGDTRDRLTLPEYNEIFAQEEPVTLQIDATQADYSPATDAVVEATISHATGDKKISLLPDAKIPGRYIGTYTTDHLGTQEVNYQVLLKSGEVLQQKTLLEFDYRKEENLHNEFQPDTLKELAYSTNGNYYHYSQLQNRVEEMHISTSGNLPEITVQRHLADYFSFLLIIIALLGGEWILRRRWGLH